MDVGEEVGKRKDVVDEDEVVREDEAKLMRLIMLLLLLKLLMGLFPKWEEFTWVWSMEDADAVVEKEEDVVDKKEDKEEKASNQVHLVKILLE